MHKVLANMNLFRVGLAGLGAAGAGTLVFALENSIDVNAADFLAHPYPLKWTHTPMYGALDMASVRRGYEVYKQVCAACHSLKWIRWRHFINNFMSKDEAKKEAAEWQIDDIDDNGQAIKRPALFNDYFPQPYPNAKAAAAANNGAAPPTLTLMPLARHGGEDYIFSLLTSYMDPPAGIVVEEGKAYNPYFIGGIIAMPQQLFDEGIEYEDGTPATIAQQAKDISTFLKFTAEPFHDTRKRWGWKLIAILPILTFVLVYAKRRVWTFIKSQQFVYRTMKGREWTAESSAPPPDPADKLRNHPKMKTE